MIGQSISSFPLAVSCLVVLYTVLLVNLFIPMEHWYVFHNVLDQLPSFTSISANFTPHDDHSYDDWCGTRYCPFTVLCIGDSILDICVVGYSCGCG